MKLEERRLNNRYKKTTIRLKRLIDKRSSKIGSLNADCDLKFVIVNPVPQDVWNRVKGFEIVSDQFEIIMSWYREPCSTLWADFVGLRTLSNNGCVYQQIQNQPGQARTL
jgi:hypothetical protein